MPVKLKARDVVAGWPRGKTTTALSPGNLTHDLGFLILGRTAWSIRDMNYLSSDVLFDAEYHDLQQEMFDRHRSEYRRPTPAWMARKIMENGGGMVIATCHEDPDKIVLGEEPKEPWRFEGPRPGSMGDEAIIDRVEKRYLFANAIITTDEPHQTIPWESIMKPFRLAKT